MAKLDQLDLAGYVLFRELSIRYGKEKAADAITAIGTVVGSSWNKNLLQYILINGMKLGVCVTKIPINQKIPFIKHIREYMNLSLLQSKVIVDKVAEGLSHTIFVDDFSEMAAVPSWQHFDAPETSIDFSWRLTRYQDFVAGLALLGVEFTEI